MINYFRNFRHDRIVAEEPVQNNFDPNRERVHLSGERSLKKTVFHHFSCDFLHCSLHRCYYKFKLLILLLFYCFKNWLEHCVLAARDSLVGGYLRRPEYRIMLWYIDIVVGRCLKVSNSLHLVVCSYFPIMN